ncbi:hypothetical protein D0Q02_20780 [Micromonospora craniellae]|uniref:von Hippel-Lindau disease tumour suppressor beta domain-containing protein n=1 Tax=Micromonospora craniellae TaxID=2294034 RepID=A0A372FW32_9ACTN|nr:hypothetical protein D0Q02_20780 [Micromonospora craniellae]
MPAHPARPALPAAPATRDDAPWTPLTATSDPVVVPAEPVRHGTGRKGHRLLLAGAATAVLGLMLTLLWPAPEAPPTAAPERPSGWVAPPPPAPAGTSQSPSAAGTTTPSASSSVGGASPTRPLPPTPASAPTGSPSSSAPWTDPPRTPGTPSTRPTSPASPPPTTRPPEQQPQRLASLPGGHERWLRSVGGGPETSIEFANLTSRPVTVHWLDQQGQRRQYRVLQPNTSYRQHTYVGHPWVITNQRGRALACFEPVRTPARAVIG